MLMKIRELFHKEKCKYVNRFGKWASIIEFDMKYRNWYTLPLQWRSNKKRTCMHNMKYEILNTEKWSRTNRSTERLLGCPHSPTKVLCANICEKLSAIIWNLFIEVWRSLNAKQLTIEIAYACAFKYRISGKYLPFRNKRIQILNLIRLNGCQTDTVALNIKYVGHTRAFHVASLAKFKNIYFYFGNSWRQIYFFT